MKRAIIAFAVVLAAATGWIPPAFALMMERELSGADPGQLSEWPPDLQRLVGYGGVVYGLDRDAPTFSRGVETMYIFFRGDHDDFNEMLKEYGKLGDPLKPYVESKEVQLLLTLHAGRGNVASAWAGVFARGKDIAFEWQITMTREGTLVPDREKRRYSVSVNLWVGGDVELNSVKVPPNVVVKSGGEIEDFIAKHEEKRRHRCNRSALCEDDLREKGERS